MDFKSSFLIVWEGRFISVKNEIFLNNCHLFKQTFEEFLRKPLVLIRNFIARIWPEYRAAIHTLRSIHTMDLCRPWRQGCTGVKPRTTICQRARQLRLNWSNFLLFCENNRADRGKSMRPGFAWFPASRASVTYIYQFFSLFIFACLFVYVSCILLLVLRTIRKIRRVCIDIKLMRLI